MARQLNLDRDKLDQCYETAGRIIGYAFKYVDRHSSLGVERATLQRLGVEGEHRGEAYASLIIKRLTKDQLRLGAAGWWGRALLSVKEAPKKLAEDLARGRLAWEKLPEVPFAQIRQHFSKVLSASQGKPTAPVHLWTPSGEPHRAVRLQDHRTRKLRPYLHPKDHEKNRWIVLHWKNNSCFEEKWEPNELAELWHLANPSHTIFAVEGLSVCEQTLLGLQVKAHLVQHDGWHAVLSKKIDPKRGLVDQAFALRLAASEGLHLLSGHTELPSGGMLKPAQTLALLLLFEQMAKRCGVAFEKTILSVNALPPETSFFEKLAFAQLLREMFSQSYLWWRLEKEDPYSLWATHFAEFDFVEAPTIENLGGLAAEFSLNTHGKVAREAHALLDQAWRLLQKAERVYLWKALEEGMLFPADHHGSPLGEAGIFQKSYHYYNPLENLWQGSVSS